ncbi:IPT/TIG domain-containing protein [Flavobacterium sp. UW10123]|uniref:IPT/TIG domain-containing protein n=1 Tax=Flavobacterium sp. UW10123 TaxID=3230800 RepID=UPI003391CF61
MKISKESIISLLILLFFVFNSCSSTDDPQYVPPTLVNFEESGLLGQPISIGLENFEVDKLQVFFDTEKARIDGSSEKGITVIVPRTLKRSNPTLKIIDLNENKTIFEKTFLLKKPVIKNYSSESISFNETLSIYGENFDTDKDFVSVFVNDEKAVIVNSDYNKIEIQIPTKLVKANLEVKVKSQLQETSSAPSLVLKNPVIKSVQSNEAWLGQIIYVDAENINPNQEFGEVYVNGIKSYFSVRDNKLEISMPPGPFKDFIITNITYKTAGLTTSFDSNIKILGEYIVVDYIENANVPFTVFVHNNKAYALKHPTSENGEFNRNYTLLEFSPSTEKWTELSTFHYNGYIVNAVYDNDDTLYLYKMSVSDQSFSLSKLNLNSFKETQLTLPSNKIVAPIFFAYQDSLYLLSGLNNNDGQISVRDQKYKYSKNSNNWTTLSSSAFEGLPLVSQYSAGGNPCDYIFNGGNIYISYGINFKTYKIAPNLSVTTYPYQHYFEYDNNIFGRYNNFFNYLYNIVTNASKPMALDSLFGYGESFFTINNEVYYLKNSSTAYYQNSLYTQKLGKDFLNGL